jgi:division protein CdvB (Snf7/Vps24/ESCRT-III family)
VTELRQIVGELAKSQAQGAIIDASQGARLETLAKRLDEIVARLDRFDVDRRGERTP